MEEEARLLEAFASLPAVSRAWAFPAATHDGVRVTVQLQQRNLAANAQRKYLTSFLVNEAVLEAGALDPSPPAEQAGVLLYAPSPSGRHLLVVRAGSGDSSAVLELWDQCRVVAERHVPQALHGAVYNDGWFGQGAARDDSPLRQPEGGHRSGAVHGCCWFACPPCLHHPPREHTHTYNTLAAGSYLQQQQQQRFTGLPRRAACAGASWSHDESLVAYVAEAPPPAKTPEWCAAAAGPDGKKAEGAAAPKGWRGQGEWSEDWGELNTGGMGGWGGCFGAGLGGGRGAGGRGIFAVLDRWQRVRRPADIAAPPTLPPRCAPACPCAQARSRPRCLCWTGARRRCGACRGCRRTPAAASPCGRRRVRCAGCAGAEPCAGRCPASSARLCDARTCLHGPPVPFQLGPHAAPPTIHPQPQPEPAAAVPPAACSPGLPVPPRRRRAGVCELAAPERAGQPELSSAPGPGALLQPPLQPARPALAAARRRRRPRRRRRRPHLPHRAPGQRLFSSLLPRRLHPGLPQPAKRGGQRRAQRHRHAAQPELGGRRRGAGGRLGAAATDGCAAGRWPRGRRALLVELTLHGIRE